MIIRDRWNRRERGTSHIVTQDVFRNSTRVSQGRHRRADAGASDTGLRTTTTCGQERSTRTQNADACYRRRRRTKYVRRSIVLYALVTNGPHFSPSCDAAQRRRRAIGLRPTFARPPRTCTNTIGLARTGSSTRTGVIATRTLRHIQIRWTRCRSASTSPGGGMREMCGSRCATDGAYAQGGRRSR